MQARQANGGILQGGFKRVGPEPQAPAQPGVPTPSNILNPGGAGPALPQLKDAVRGSLALASGGVTEDIANASGTSVEKPVPPKTMSPEERLKLYLQSNPLAMQQQQAGMLVRVPAGWQPGTRTGAEAATGKDPDAVRAAMDLQGRSQYHGALALEGEQAAERANLDGMQQVQQNEMRAIQHFKGEQDKIQDRYDADRAATNARLADIQKAMSADPNAPRTIRQWLDKSGTGEKLTYGIAAALSAMGGGVSKDGGASSRNLINIVQGNIDRNVQAEKDRFDRLGTLHKMEESTYARLREAVGDDRIAQNATKAMYYDAVMNTTKQLALQYKWDMQSPAISQMMQHFLEAKQKLILDTAQTVQEQTSQTDKYNPGGVVMVGGSKKEDKNPLGLDSKELQDSLKDFDKLVKDEGGYGAREASATMKGAIAKVAQIKDGPSDKFWSAVMALGRPGDEKVQGIIAAVTDPQESAALADISKAMAFGLKDEAGKNVTTSEAMRTALQAGGFSVDGLKRFKDYSDRSFDAAVRRANAAAGQAPSAPGREGRITELWRARYIGGEANARDQHAIGQESPAANYRYQRELGIGSEHGSDSRRSE